MARNTPGPSETASHTVRGYIPTEGPDATQIAYGPIGKRISYFLTNFHITAFGRR
jgi:hypothetical protein